MHDMMHILKLFFLKLTTFIWSLDPAKTDELDWKKRRDEGIKKKKEQKTREAAVKNGRGHLCVELLYQIWDGKNLYIT